MISSMPLVYPNAVLCSGNDPSAGVAGPRLMPVPRPAAIVDTIRKELAYAV